MYNPDLHHRRSIRLPTHDYAAGGTYYITLCTEARRRLFGTILNGRMVLNDAGRAVCDEWLRSAEIRAEITLDEWVVMPDHFHAVVVFRRGDRQVALPRVVAPRRMGGPPVAPTGPAPRSLGALVAGFKSASGKRVNEWRETPGATVWHRNYYEHIVRGDADLARIRSYIRDNPANYDVLRFGEPHFMLGNRALLDLPKTAFLASRVTVGASVRATGGSPQERATCRSPLRDFPTPPACVISGFLSPLERTVFDACLAASIPMVQVLACGLPTTYGTRVRSALNAGRLLLMTPFPETVAQVSANRAAWCNQYLLHIAHEVVIGHLNPDGMLACLVSDIPCDTPVTILKEACP